MANLVRDQLLSAYDWTQLQLRNSFESIPEDKYLHQPFPGANHALWMMGHLATVDQFMLKLLAGRDAAIFEQYKTVFFAKSAPTPNAGDYPPIEVVREYFRTSRAEYRGWLVSLDDERLLAPMPAELQRWAPNLGDFLFRLVWHEGMHYGQMTVIRKSLGMAPLRI